MCSARISNLLGKITILLVCLAVAGICSGKPAAALYHPASAHTVPPQDRERPGSFGELAPTAAARLNSSRGAHPPRLRRSQPRFEVGRKHARGRSAGLPA